LSQTGQLSGVVHAIRSNIESNSIRSLSLIGAAEVKSGTTLEDADNQPINARAANFSEPTLSGTRESERAGSRPSLETGTKWFEIKRRNNRHIDREPSG
jgi:hypothetical protein